MDSYWRLEGVKTTSTVRAMYLVIDPRALLKTNHCSAALFLLTSLSSEIVSLVPLPLGKDIHGLTPSPMAKMLVTL